LLLGFVALLVVSRGSADEFLPMKQAFQYFTSATDSTLTVRFEIAPGYYLYRERLSFASTTPGIQLGAPVYPPGETHEDDYFGRQIVYRNRVSVPIAVERAANSREFDLQIKLQGCADAGLCYPPTTWTAHVAAPPVRSAVTAPEKPASSAGVNLRSLVGTGATGGDGRFLKPDHAFVLAADSAQPDRVEIDWQIADGYYLYRDRITVRSLTADVELGAPRLPEGESHQDDYFGTQTVYRGLLAIDVPISHAASVRQLPLEIGYQGCADAGLCYPPIKKQITVTLTPLGHALAATADAATPGAGGTDTPRSEQDTLADRIRDGGLLGMLAFFFGAGLLLSLTPCVLPMVPILSGIIVGAGRDRPISRGRAFALSFAYVLGMALTYTIAGAAFAAAGQQAQAFFQKPWMIATFAGLFVVLALGMFGLFTIQMPAALQAKVSDASNRQSQGTLLGTAIMGALSSLIVTACVAPPLVAALAVIGQSGNVVRGGAALFAMSLGMGMPLLVVGASAGQLLPKAGPWMDTIKAVFGVLLLGVAVWMLSRILPGPVTLALWATLAFVTGYCLMTAGGREASGGLGAVRRGFGALATVYGILLLIGALAGRSNPLQPLAGMGGPGAASSTQAAELSPFKRIKSVADLERELAVATAAGKPAMLDFYADWCVSCKEMEHYTFPDPGVRAELDQAVLLQADVTANDAEDQALLRRFQILGPPSIVFFDATGRERPEFRVVGFKPAPEFRAHLARAFGSSPP
jgi:thiol:disulfide interchange protein DsbD